MPYVTARDSTRLYYEEPGTGSPILFLHEFARHRFAALAQFRRSRGRGPWQACLTRLPKLQPINQGYLGVRRAACKGRFPHPRRPKFQKRPYFSVDGAHGQGAKYAAKTLTKLCRSGQYAASGRISKYCP
jgi:hypothetical protein